MEPKNDHTAATVVSRRASTPEIERAASDTDPVEPKTAPQHADDPALSALDLIRLEKRFIVKRLLGAGGMGVVVEVKDRVLGRDVAVKLLYGSEDEARTRFLREARATAMLRHDGIVTVHDIDAEGGYIVMELITGGSLADRLREHPKLPTAEVRRIATALLSALGAAHDAGIVHRDVKPANILFDAAGGDEHAAVKLADFGIASFGDSKLTSTGTRIGTPDYMAPEQLRGRACDGRADIYAAGATLFEAATGKKLHREEGRVRDPGREVREATGDEALAVALAKAVAEHASDRFATAGEFAAALGTQPRRRRWIAVAAIAAVLAAGTVAIAMRGSGDAKVAISSPVIAILPFRDRTNDARLDFAGLGLPNLLAGELRTIPGVTVIDSYELRDRMSDLDPQPPAWISAARARGANLVLRGELTRSGAGVKVTAILEHLDGTIVATHERDAAIPEVTSVVHDLATRVVDSLGIAATLGSATGRAMEIERLLQLGIAAAEGNDLETALQLLDRVVAREPQLAEAHTYRALVLEWLGKPPGEILAAIEKALAGKIDPAKRTFLEGLKLLVNRRYHEAIPFFRAADQRFPDHREILYGLFEALFHGDDPAASLAVYRRLVELSPRLKLATYHPLAYSITRDDRATTDWVLARSDEASRLDWQVRALISRREYAQAGTEVERALVKQGDRFVPNSWSQRIAIRALTGKLDDAVKAAEQLGDRERMVAALPRWSLAIARGEPVGEWRDDALRAPAMQDVGVTRFEGWLTLTTFAVVGDPSSLRRIADGLEASRKSEPGEIAQGDVGRALLGGALDDADLLALARHDGFLEAVAVADAFDAAKRGQHDRAIAAWRRAIDASTDGRYIAVEQYFLAKSARAAGQHARVVEACGEVIEPRVFGWEWGALVGPCRTWIAEAKAKK